MEVKRGYYSFLFVSWLSFLYFLHRKRRKLHRRRYFSPGPHFVWHIDGYDKIKPFGFGISGCIDGFSRRILWLNVYKTNNDPKVIAGYFVETIAEMSGCPSFVRGDRGTENTLVKELQQILMGNRRNGHGHSYLEGSSTSNQRIECFWGHLRKQCMEFWICKFHELQDSGDFVNDFVDKNILLFCFTAIIQVSTCRCISGTWIHNCLTCVSYTT